MILLDIASSALSYYLFSVFELIFILIPMIIFKLQKKDLKYEFRHRIVPNETLYRNKHLGFRVADISAGIIIGVFFKIFGRYLWLLIYYITVATQGEDAYVEAAAGLVDTTTPPPPPDPVLIWTLIITGVIIQFLFVSLSEEFLFRGVILKEIGHKSKLLGIILSSGFFMLYHLFPGIVPWQTFQVFWLYFFGFGVLLSSITVFSKGDLTIAIVAHGTFNAIGWVTRYLQYLP